MLCRLAFAALILPVVINPARADCIDDVHEAMKRIETSGPYRAEGTITMAGMTTDVVSEVVPPDAMSVRFEGEGYTSRAVVVDGRAWANEGPGWVEFKEGLARDLTAMIRDAAIAKLPELFEAQCLGEVEFEGATVLAYQLDHDEEGNRQSAKVLVDPQTGRPIQVDAKGEFPMGPSSSLLRYSYDPAITIEPPDYD